MLFHWRPNDSFLLAQFEMTKGNSKAFILPLNALFNL